MSYSFTQDATDDGKKVCWRLYSDELVDGIPRLTVISNMEPEPGTNEELHHALLCYKLWEGNTNTVADGAVWICVVSDNRIVIFRDHEFVKGIYMRIEENDKSSL